MTIVYGILIVACIGVALYFVSDAFKSAVKSIWGRWFRDSEVNLAADFMSLTWVVDFIANDPEIPTILGKVGLSPTSLLVIGIGLRLLRGSRDRTMIPLTKHEPM